jgi:hypothetical protein
MRPAKISFTTLLCLAACLAFAGCSAFKASETSTFGGAAGGSAELSKSPAKGTTVLISTQHNLFAINQALVQTPASASTIAVYGRPHSVLERGNLLPKGPEAAALNSSQQMVYTLTATEHCSDLVASEAAISDASRSSRKFFKTLNLAAGSTPMTAAEFQDAGTALGTSFWRRSTTDEEKSLFGQIYAEALGEGLSNQKLLVSLCTIELASASSLVH